MIKLTLVYIENELYLKKILYLLKSSNISFTTNFNDNYDSIVIAELNSRTLNIVRKNNNKRIIFLFHLEELRFSYHFSKQNKSSLLYKNKLYELLKLCNDIVVSLPYFQKLLSGILNKNVYVIPRINPSVYSVNKKGLIKKYDLGKNKKKILVIDSNYQYLDYIYSLAHEYNSIEFIYISYTPSYRLTKSKQKLLDNKPINLKMEIDYSIEVILELIELSSVVIYTSDLYDYNYLLMALMHKKQLFIKNFFAFDSYLVNSKNCYTFESKDELKLKIDKLLNERISYLGINGYELIKNNNYSQIVYMIQNYFK